MRREIAVAVISWNTREPLRACLDSLRDEHDAARAEIWVVDNGSSDGSLEMVRADFPWVQTIAAEENLGYGAGVNLVAERTDSRWIVAANSDIVVGNGAIDMLLDAAELDPSAGSLAPRLVLPNGETQHSVHAFPTLLPAVLLNAGIVEVSPTLADRLCAIGHWKERRARRVDWAHGAFLMIKREAWDAVGGFDPRQWMYAEDIDLAWRLRRAGWFTRYEPRATVHHAVSAATSQAFGEDRARAIRHMTATYRWLDRRRGSAHACATAGVNIAGAGVHAFGWSLLARTGSRWAARKQDRWLWHLDVHRAGFKDAVSESEQI